MKDFFISYNKADRTWAEWLAWQLEEAGYTVVLQAWDFRPGDNFVLRMQQATTEATRTIAVLSPDYVTALYTQSEWAAAFKQDPTGERGTLLPVRVREVALTGLLAALVYIDLVALDEPAAKAALLAGINRARAKPAAAPAFPGAPSTAHTIATPPRYPGMVPPVMDFVALAADTFQMGSTETDDAQPVHEERIALPFDLGVSVVTQGTWRGVMNTAPWHGERFVQEGDDYPAVYVSWEDAQEFIARLNAQTTTQYYRLPTEAEWEYAARAGTTTRFSFGDDERALNAYGWYKANALDAGEAYAHRVKQRRPNAWGLYDLHGNVWEWVDDWYYGSYAPTHRLENPTDRVVRGGAWDYPAAGARSAFRNHVLPTRSSETIGFRLVRMQLE